MRDQRVDALAQILVRYSTKVQKGELCVVQGQSSAEPDRVACRTAGAARAHVKVRPCVSGS